MAVIFHLLSGPAMYSARKCNQMNGILCVFAESFPCRANSIKRIDKNSMAGK
jgi:hypothetical protein